MICPKCGKKNKEGSQFCEGCGVPLNSSNQGLFAKFKNMSTLKKGLSIIGIFILIFILLLVVAALASPSETTTIKVSNLKLSSNGYGLYDFSCDIVPDKDYSYLQAEVIFYGSNGEVLDKSPLVWNMNNIAKNQTIKASGSAYLSGNNVPSYAKVLFFDKTFSSEESDAIYVQNVTL